MESERVDPVSSGVARPGPSRARPDLTIDYHVDMQHMLSKNGKFRQRFMFIDSELAPNFASCCRSSSILTEPEPLAHTTVHEALRGCGQIFSRKQARALCPTYSLFLATPLAVRYSTCDCISLRYILGRSKTIWRTTS